MTPSKDIEQLLAIMATLRHPTDGCPWDVRQTFASIAPYTLEEAHEVVDAIERDDMEDLRDELGDLLLQVVFHARMAEEAGTFTFGDVVESITAKLVRRHPHVFGPARVSSPDAVKRIWEVVKAEEAKARRRRLADGQPEPDDGALAGVPAGLPALLAARKLQEKAARVGFDWHEAARVIDKVREETQEIADALAEGSQAAVAAEIGDLLFAAVNLARHVGIDPETALRGSNAKFRRRFGVIETELRKRGLTPDQASLDEMEGLWQAAKALEHAASEA